MLKNMFRIFAVSLLFAGFSFSQGILSGIVVSKKEKGLISGASITLLRYTTNPHEMKATPVLTTKTDVNGNWSFQNVKPDKYRLTITPPQVKPQPKSSGPSPKLASVQKIIDVPSTGLRDIVIELSAEAIIAGTIQTDKGSAPADSMFIIATDEVQDIVSGTDMKKGSFRIANLSKGDFFLNLTSEEGYYAEKIFLGSNEITDTAIIIEDGQNIENIRILLSKTKGILRGKVIGLQGDDFRLVVLIPAKYSAKSALRSSTPEATDEKGEFEISERPGEYFVALIDSNTLALRNNNNAVEWLDKITKDVPKAVVAAGETTMIALSLPR